MKNLISILLALMPLIGLSQANPFGAYRVNNVTMSSGALNAYGDTIIAPTSPSTPDHISGTAQVNLTASQQVSLLPGFYGNAFTGTGNFVGQIGTGNGPITNAEVMGTSNEGNQYEKFEIGINLENDANARYLTQIGNFLSDPRNPDLATLWPYPPFTTYTYASIAHYLNPYDPDQVKIKAVFTNQSSGHQFTRYGFYREYANDTLSGTEYHVHTDNNFPFRVRFAPPETGTWTVQLSLYINDTLAPGNQPFTANFNVNSTTNPGDVVVHPIYPWHFAYKGSGAMFIPQGQNIPWADRYDPNVSNQSTLNTFDGDANNNACTLQRNYISDLATHKGNFIRLWMYPYSNGIEYGTQNQYSYSVRQPSIICDYRQDYSWELDNTISECEQKGIYTQLCIEPGLSYDDSGAWSGYGYPDAPLFWSPYYFLLGGSSSHPDLINFFTSALAQNYFKKRLFYIEARWGYSPNIAIWELNNEVDNLGEAPDSASDEYWGKSGPYSALDFQEAYTRWADSMTTYLHGLYPSHLVATSYGQGPGTWDATALLTDVLELHDYNQGPDEDYQRVSRPYSAVSGNPLIQSGFGALFGQKPFLYGELGTNCSPGIDYQTDCNFHQAEWAALFSTSGAGLYWYDWQQGPWPSVSNCTSCGVISHRNNFDALSTFCNNLSSTTFTDTGWSPASQYYAQPGVVTYYSNNTYTGEQTGWFNNSTVNWRNTTFDYAWPFDTDACISAQTTPSVFYGYFAFVNLNESQEYQVNVYNTYTGAWFYNTTATTDPYGNLTLAWVLASSADPSASNSSIPQPDYAYYLSPTGSHASVARQDSTIITLPNDTVYIPMDSICYKGIVDAKHKNYQFSWNFGNGQTSTAAPFPKFIYYTIGNYPNTTKLTDSAGGDKTTIYQTYVVLDSASKKQLAKLNSPTDKEETNIVVLVPNPTAGTFAVYLTNGQAIENIKIYDVFGRECFSEYSPKNNVFNVSSFAAGVYIVYIQSNGNTITQKLVKE